MGGASTFVYIGEAAFSPAGITTSSVTRVCFIEASSSP